MPRRRYVALAVLVVVLGLGGVAANQAANAAAGALLYPGRRPVAQPPPAGCADASFAGDRVRLSAWRCAASGRKRGTLIFLHGVGDNRVGAAGTLGRFTSRGLDVIAYDSRAHGNSTGTVCTYGYWEKRDLHTLIDSVPPGPVILLGTSLGAAVALQDAAEDRRVAGVVAAESFSDLRTVASERAPWFLTRGVIRNAFTIAEARGHFRVDDVSPVNAARAIHVPVLLIHGADDRDTSPEHSRRIFAALAGRRDFLLVPGAGHNQSLGKAWVWQRIERWIENVLQPPAIGHHP